MADVAEVLDQSRKRIDWSKFTDDEMFQIAIWADRHGHVGLLRKVQRASLRRALRDASSGSEEAHDAS